MTTGGLLLRLLNCSDLLHNIDRLALFHLTESAEAYSGLTAKFLTALALRLDAQEGDPHLGTTKCPPVDSFNFVFTRVNEDSTNRDVMTDGSTHLPTESEVIGSGCYVSVNAVNATNKVDVSSTTQEVVLHRLWPLLSCLP
jgi:5'-nucleotidase